MNLLLELRLDPSEASADEQELLLRKLRAELTDLEIDIVRADGQEKAPIGAKGTDPVTLGALVVALSASGGVFTSVIDTVKDWLSRHSARHHVKITIAGDSIELSGATSQQRQDLVDAFVRRYTSDRPTSMSRRVALLVATHEHEDPGLAQLTAPAADAEALAAVLRDPAIADFDVTVLVNEPHYVVGPAIGDLYRDRRRDDVTLLYFTGHGLKDDAGRLYLLRPEIGRDRGCGPIGAPARRC